MAPDSQPPPMAQASMPYRSTPKGPILPISNPSPIQPPHSVYLGRHSHLAWTPQLRAYDRVKGEHGSFSSASTGSSIHNAVFPATSPAHMYLSAYSISSQVREGSVEAQRTTRAYPNQYTRPSECEMAEIHAAYQHSHEVERSQDDPKYHAIKLLVWLSLLDPLYCLAAAFYTLLILLPLSLLSPLRLCGSSYRFSRWVVRCVSPILDKHLMILSGHSMDEKTSLEYKPVALVVVYLAAPVCSLVVAIAAWVSASFWVFAIIMGNPDGTERRDDGRATVLGVKNRWERFLLFATR